MLNTIVENSAVIVAGAAVGAVCWAYNYFSTKEKEATEVKDEVSVEETESTLVKVTVIGGIALGAACLAYGYYKSSSVIAENILGDYYKAKARTFYGNVSKREAVTCLKAARIALRQTENKVAGYWFSVPADLKQQLIANRAIVAHYSEQV